MIMKMEMSKTYQYRKVMKPMLERKRRARINKCLDDLKDLMVDCLTQEGEHVTRLEKADILELTVDHMKKLKQRGTLATSSSNLMRPSSPDCFRSGFVHAADQISKVLAATPGIDVNLGTKLMTYLGKKLTDIHQQPPIQDYCSRSFELQMASSTPIIIPPLFINFNQSCGTSAWNHGGLMNVNVKSGANFDTDLSENNVWRPW